MKILHTADLHLGQLIYQHYDRADEHAHFFTQLKRWCQDEKPDALLVCGDVFDIPQPSASVRKQFNEDFAGLHNALPEMKIVIIAGNHDSASRIEADHAIWQFGNCQMIGMPPSPEWLKRDDEDWMDQYVIRLNSGFIIALPYMSGQRQELLQRLLDHVNHVNVDNLPVVVMGHLAVSGADITGHGDEIGSARYQTIEDLGTGYDYFALGHIHKPQTIGHPEDFAKDEVSYPAGVIRYSGSALHVSCDETYPHSVSLVDIDKHGGIVNIKQLRIDEYRHFYVLPLNNNKEEGDVCIKTPQEALDAISKLMDEQKRGYFRLCLDYNADFPSDFDTQIFSLLEVTKDDMRYNPKHIYLNTPQADPTQKKVLNLKIADLQQMRNPLTFIEETRDQYPGLHLDDEANMQKLREAFEEIQREIKRIEEDKKLKAESKAKAKAKDGESNDNNAEGENTES